MSNVKDITVNNNNTNIDMIINNYSISSSHNYFIKELEKIKQKYKKPKIVLCKVYLKNKQLIDSFTTDLKVIKIQRFFFDSILLTKTNPNLLQYFSKILFQKCQIKSISISLSRKKSLSIFKGLFYSKNITKINIILTTNLYIAQNMMVKILRIMVSASKGGKSKVCFDDNLTKTGKGINILKLYLALNLYKHKLSGTNININVQSNCLLNQKLLNKLDFQSIYINSISDKIRKTLKENKNFITICSKLKFEKGTSKKLFFSCVGSSKTTKMRGPIYYIQKWFPEYILNREYNLFIKLMVSHKKYKYSANWYNTVRPIKEYMALKLDTDVDQIRLMFAGKELLETKTIQRYGISKDSTLHCLIKT